MKEVTKYEFYEFVKKYPNDLVTDCCGMSEPPTITYNDFTLGNWPQSVVAQTTDTENSKYFINENILEGG
jgi:hypothetical protein